MKNIHATIGILKIISSMSSYGSPGDPVKQQANLKIHRMTHSIRNLTPQQKDQNCETK